MIWKFSQRTIFIIISLFLIVITNIPYIYGALNTPDGMNFTGIAFSGDIATYFSRIEQYKQGNILLQNLYTTEPQEHALFDPFWLLVGLTAKYLNLTPVFAFHLFRVFLTPLFVIVASAFIETFLKNRFQRLLALILFFFTSGIGALSLFILKPNGYMNGTMQAPLDVWVPEAFPFFSILVTPHFIASSTLLILVLLLSFQGFRDNSTKKILQASFIAFVLFLFHPFKVPVIYGLLGCFTLIISFLFGNWIQNFKKLFLFILCSSPAVLYVFWMITTNTVWRLHAQQNINLTPSFMYVLLGYGVILPLALFGILSTARKKKIDTTSENIFLLTWLIFGFFLLYSDFPYQRRFAEGLFLPLCIFASYGVVTLHFKFQVYKKNMLLPISAAVGTFLLLVITNTTLLISYTDIFAEAQKYQYSQSYIPQEFLEAFEWIQENTDENTAILADPQVGNLLPAYTGRKVFIGHKPMTLFFDEKYQTVRGFFKSNTFDDEKKQFIEKHNIQYIFWSAYEQRLGAFRPENKGALRKVFETNRVAVYRYEKFTRGH